MDEALEFKTTATLGDRRDFGKRQLACENDARKADVLQREDTFKIVGDELRRGMKRERREMATTKACNAEILYNERVRADFLKPRERLDGLLDVNFVDERIERDVDLLPLRVREADEMPKIFEREVFRKRPRGEVGKTAVYRVRASVKRRERRLEIPSGGKKFRLAHLKSIKDARRLCDALPRQLRQEQCP